MHQKHILIVEDDKFIARTLINEFTVEGFTVDHVFNGDQAIDLMKKTLPDIVLLDLLLPQKNGFEVLTDIRGDATLKNVPVIVLTNLDQDADRDRATNLGAVDYMVKAHNSLGHIVERVKEYLASNAKE